MDRLSKIFLSDRLNALVGILLFASPWMLDFSSHSDAAISAQIAGAAIFGLAILETIAFHKFEEWIGCAFGAWLLVAPWVLGFNEASTLVATHLLAGLLTILFTIGSLTDHSTGDPATH